MNLTSVKAWSIDGRLYSTPGRARAAHAASLQTPYGVLLSAASLREPEERTLLVDEGGNHYEASLHRVHLDLPSREEVLAKLTEAERAAIGLGVVSRVVT